MEKAVPVLQIDDYKEAKIFYVEKLGFEILFEARHEPGFPVFMGIQKGDLLFCLSEHGRGHQGTEVYLYVDDIELWRAACERNSISIEQPPTAMPWGNKEMLVKDPFRNALRFSQEPGD